MRSMTGFGRAEGKVGTNHFTVEVKSVNHRYLDARIRLPHVLSVYESVFTEKVKTAFERGSFEVSIRHRLDTEGNVSTGTKFVVDEGAAKSLLTAAEGLKKQYQLSVGPTFEFLALTQRVFLSVEEQENPEGILKGVLPIFETALAELKKMRDSEGAKIKKVLQGELDSLSKQVTELGKFAGEQPKKIQEKLKQRIASWNLSGTDSQRVELEVAFYAERADVTEELDRLKAHIRAYATHLEEPKSIGRRLDFLTQELNREVNTIGAKAAILEMTQATVTAKMSIERLREQVQNVE